jgi:hypothetical protein
MSPDRHEDGTQKTAVSGGTFSRNLSAQLIAWTVIPPHVSLIGSKMCIALEPTKSPPVRAG